MIRSPTQPDLTEGSGALTDWIKEPIHTGSIYVKPTEDKNNCKCFAYIYFFCCGYIRSR